MIPQPLTTDEIEELLAQEVWASRNGETIMDPYTEADPLYRRAQAHRANTGQGHTLDGWHDERRAWLLVAVCAALVGLALWGLG